VHGKYGVYEGDCKMQIIKILPNTACPKSRYFITYLICKIFNKNAIVEAERAG
jgi:hypothetical protein